jgi:hypothetical protein
MAAYKVATTSIKTARTAQRSAEVMLGAGRLSARGQAAAGAAGTAALGAATVAPISMFEQLNDNGVLESKRVFAEAGFGALGAAGVGAVLNKIGLVKTVTPAKATAFRAAADDDLAKAVDDFFAGEEVPDSVKDILPDPVKQRIGKSDQPPDIPMPKQTGEMHPATLTLLGFGSAGAAVGAVGSDDPAYDAAWGAVLGIGAAATGMKLKTMANVGKWTAKITDSMADKRLRITNVADDWEALMSKGSLALHRFKVHIDDAVPDGQRQEAITHYLEGNLAKSELSAAELEVANAVKSWYAGQGARGQKFGVLGELLDNYVTHLWRRTGMREQELLDVFHAKGMSPNTRFSRQRIIPDYQEGIEAGLEPVTLKIGEIVKVYGESLNRAIANKQLIKALREGGFLKDVKNAPREWASISHPQLHGLKVHPEIVPSLKFMFSTFEPNLITEGAAALNYAMKRLAVSFSAFHLNALVESTIFALGHPMDSWKLLRGTHPVLEQLHKGVAGDEVELLMRAGLKIGVVEDVGGDTFYASMRDLSRWMDKKLPYSGKVPAAFLSVSKFVDKIMWDRYMTGAKLVVAMKELERAGLTNGRLSKAGIARHGTPEQLAADVAEYVNDAFGGLNWRRISENTRTRLGRDIKMTLFSPKGRLGLQLGMFAPDWTTANLRIVLKAIPGMSSNKYIGSLHRRYVLRAGIYTATLMNGINYMMSGHFMWDNDDPTYLDMGDGRRMVSSKQFMEPIHWLENPAKQGLNKMAVLPGLMLQQGLNKEWLSPGWTPNIYPRGATFSDKFTARIQHAGSKFLPISAQQANQSGSEAALWGFFGHPIYGATPEQRAERRANRR